MEGGMGDDGFRRWSTSFHRRLRLSMGYSGLIDQVGTFHSDQDHLQCGEVGTGIH